MAVDMFLKIEEPGIPGETKDKAKTGEIDVLAWSWGASNSGSAHMGGGQGAGKANFQDISLTMWFEKSTPVLLGFVSKGTHFQKATLTCRKAGDKPLEYIIMTMEDCIITSVSFGGSGGEDRLTINVSMNFGKFTMKYIEQDDKGAEKSKPEFMYDIAASSAE